MNNFLTRNITLVLCNTGFTAEWSNRIVDSSSCREAEACDDASI